MNPWDDLSDIFGCKWDEEEISASVADNILIAWPSIIDCIEGYFGSSSGLKVLDFGCGGGHLCRKFHSLGNVVAGYDTSGALIEAARKNVPDDVTITDSQAIFKIPATYDLITSIMVFPFIKDIDSALKHLLLSLKPGGLLVYAVFNPQFVLNSLKENLLFREFSVGKNEGFMEIREGMNIPVYIRDKSEYRKIFEELGCTEVYLDLPPFTEEFLKKYPIKYPANDAEFLIQAFKK